MPSIGITAQAGLHRASLGPIATPMAGAQSPGTTSPRWPMSPGTINAFAQQPPGHHQLLVGVEVRQIAGRNRAPENAISRAAPTWAGQLIVVSSISG